VVSFQERKGQAEDAASYALGQIRRANYFYGLEARIKTIGDIFLIF